MSGVFAQPHEFNMGGVKCSTHTIPQLLEEVRALLERRYDQPRSILCVQARLLPAPHRIS